MAGQGGKQLSKRERIRLRRIILLLAAVSILLLLFFPGRGYMSYKKMRNRVDALRRENARLEQRNRELAEEITRLQTDEAYLEELARKKYGLLRDNEIVYEFKSARKEKKKEKKN